MSRHFLLLFLLLNISFTGLGQVIVEGTVTDARTKEKIPYASVSVGTSGTYTDLDGLFQLSIKDSLQDSLYIKCLGYEIKSYSLKAIQKQQLKHFTLTPLPVQIAEVTISSDRRISQPGKIKGKSELQYRGPYKGYNQEIARLISLDTIRGKYIRLKKIRYFIAGGLFDDSEHRAPFGVRLYAIDSVTGLPGQELLPRNIVIQARKSNGWAEAELDSLRIYLPHTPVFASMQWLPIHAQYWWTNTYTRPGTKKKITDTIYGQNLGFTTVPGETQFYIKYNSNWSSFEYPRAYKFNTPMIYLEVEVFD